MPLTSPDDLKAEIANVLTVFRSPSDLDPNVYSTTHYIIQDILALIDRERRAAAEEALDRSRNKRADLTAEGRMPVDYLVDLETLDEMFPDVAGGGGEG